MKIKNGNIVNWSPTTGGLTVNGNDSTIINIDCPRVAQPCSGNIHTYSVATSNAYTCIKFDDHPLSVNDYDSQVAYDNPGQIIGKTSYQNKTGFYVWGRGEMRIKGVTYKLSNRNWYNSIWVELDGNYDIYLGYSS